MYFDNAILGMVNDVCINSNNLKGWSGSKDVYVRCQVLNDNLVMEQCSGEVFDVVGLEVKKPNTHSAKSVFVDSFNLIGWMGGAKQGVECKVVWLSENELFVSANGDIFKVKDFEKVYKDKDKKKGFDSRDIEFYNVQKTIKINNDELGYI